MVADLIDEPYLLRIDEIANLTPLQIKYLYGRPRDRKTGQPKALPYLFNREKENKLDEKNKFYEMGMAFGMSTDELDKQWAEQYGW